MLEVVAVLAELLELLVLVVLAVVAMVINEIQERRQMVLQTQAAAGVELERQLKVVLPAALA